jgi:hypothetical protein
MSYRPAGSAVTDGNRGCKAGSRRHRRSRHPAGFLLRAALALASIVGAGLTSASGALPAAESPRTIRLLEIARTTHGRLIDHNGNHQPDMGDSIASASDLFRWDGSRRGPRVGHIWRLCILATRRTGNCAATVFLPDGTVRIYGYVDFDRAPDELAVLGGTGAYLGMRGSFTSQPLGPGSARSSDLVRLLR